MNVGNIITYISYAVAAASAAAAVLPQGAPGSTWANVRKIINVLAANFGNAKNKGE